MTGIGQYESRSIGQVTGRLLSRVFGRPVLADRPRRLTTSGRRNVLWRVPISTSGSAEPATVLVKQRSPELYDPDSPAALGTREVLNEWAGLEFLQELITDNGALTPRFYAGDLAHGLFVMEDLGAARSTIRVGDRLREESPSLVQPLLGRDAPTAEIGLERMMYSLGRMHGLCAGNLDIYRRIRRKLDASYDDEAEHDVRLRFLDRAVAIIRESGVNVERGFEDEIASFRSAIEAPGQWLTFGHGDACPDNWLAVKDSLLLIDFEFAGPQHALLDGTFPRMAFPTCWCCRRLDTHLVERLESVYREQAAVGIPQMVDDDLFRLAKAQGLVFWAMNSLRWYDAVKAQDRLWGVSSTRARILFRLSQLEHSPVVAELYPAITATTRSLSAGLANDWGEIELSTFPALGGESA